MRNDFALLLAHIPGITREDAAIITTAANLRDAIEAGFIKLDAEISDLEEIRFLKTFATKVASLKDLYRAKLNTYYDVERLTVLLTDLNDLLSCVNKLSQDAQLKDTCLPSYPKERLGGGLSSNAELVSEIIFLKDICIRHANAIKKLASIKVQDFKCALLPVVASKRAEILAAIEAKLMVVDSRAALEKMEKELDRLRFFDAKLSNIFEFSMPPDLSVTIPASNDLDEYGFIVSELDRQSCLYSDDLSRVRKLYEERCKVYFDKRELNSSLVTITLKRVKILAEILEKLGDPSLSFAGLKTLEDKLLALKSFDSLLQDALPTLINPMPIGQTDSLTAELISKWQKYRAPTTTITQIPRLTSLHELEARGMYRGDDVKDHALDPDALLEGFGDESIGPAEQRTASSKPAVTDTSGILGFTATLFGRSAAPDVPSDQPVVAKVRHLTT